MPEWLRVGLAALAVYRLAALVAIDSLPFDLMLRIRDAAGVYDRGADGRPTREFARLISCPYCIGLWLAIPAAAVCIWPARWSDAVLLVLGISGAAAYMQGPRQAR